MARRLTRDHREIVKALQRCIFNVVMNNRDDHAKNFAFVLNEHKEWRLAPPYDLTYAPGYRGEHFMDAEAEAVLDAMLDKLTVQAFRQDAAQLPIPPSVVDHVAIVIEVNRKRLERK